MKKIKMVMQMKQTECGLCVVQMLLNYYGAMVELTDINKKIEVGRDGLSLRKMKNILADYGMETALFQTKSKDLFTYKHMVPFVALSKKGHYVVVEKIEKEQVKIVDPAVGKRAISYEEYWKEFLEKIFKATPGENFVHIKKTNHTNIFLEGAMENRKAFAVMMLIAMLVYIMMLVNPLISQKVLKLLLRSQMDKQTLTKWSIAIMTMFLAYIAALFMKSKANVRISILLDKYLSNTVINKLLKNDISFFIQRTSADIQYRLSLLRGVKSMVNDLVVTSILDAGSMIVILIYVAISARSYALILMLFTVVVFSMNILLKSRVILYKNEETAADSKLQVLQNDMFRSITDIKVLGLQWEKKEQWENAYDEYADKHKKYELLMAKYASVLSALNVFVPISVVLLGVWQVIINGDSNEIAVIISLQTILSLYLSSLLSVSNMADNIYLIKAYMVRINDIMNQDDELSGFQQIKFEGNIKAKHLCFKYPGDDKYVLKDINIEINKGEKIAFTGSTGSGKSTLLNILVGLFNDYEGNIEIEGVDLKDIDKGCLKKSMSVVPQNSLLFNGSLKDNLDITGEHSDEEIFRALGVVGLDGFVRELPMKLNTVIAENGFNFSGGQRQRISLARAIINSENVICLDEATSSLDNLTEAKIVDYFAGKKTTQIVVAHRLSTIKDADRIYVMKNGRIVEQGKHQELIELNGEYRDLYEKEERYEVLGCVG